MIHIILNAGLRAALRRRLAQPPRFVLNHAFATGTNRINERGSGDEPEIDLESGQPINEQPINEVENQPKDVANGEGDKEQKNELKPESNGHANPEDTVESLELRKLRLTYQSQRRGIIERNGMLTAFVEKYLDGLNDAQTAQYDALINNGPTGHEIYYWATNAVPTPPEYDNEVMQMLKQHVADNLREIIPHFYE